MSDWASSASTSLSQEWFVKLREDGSVPHGFLQVICLIPTLPRHIGDCKGKMVKGIFTVLFLAAGILISIVCHRKLLSKYFFYILCKKEKCVKKEKSLDFMEKK